MMDPQTAYFFKRFYRNIIKWWFVIYNPVAKKIWPSKAEEEEARKKEEHQKEEHQKKETTLTLPEKTNGESNAPKPAAPIADETYNSTTGAFSGLYGQGPMDDHTQSMLDEIMNRSSSQSSIDSILQNSTDITPAPDVVLPPEQEEIIQEANAIYERLLREAKEDEERKAAEIEAAKQAAAT